MEKCLHIIPRKIAKERGLKRYFTGRPCKNGGIDQRHVCSFKCMCRKCKDSRLGAHRHHCSEWRKRNPKKANLWSRLSESERKKRSKKYYENKRSAPEKIKAKNESNRNYRQRNPVAMAEYRNKWNKENKELKAHYQRRRRAAKLQAPGHHTTKDVENILRNQRYRCAACQSNVKKVGYHVDHIQPISRGGADWPENLQILCPSCNLRKHNKDPIEWAQENGRLL